MKDSNGFVLAFFWFVKIPGCYSKRIKPYCYGAKKVLMCILALYNIIIVRKERIIWNGTKMQRTYWRNL